MRFDSFDAHMKRLGRQPTVFNTRPSSIVGLTWRRGAEGATVLVSTRGRIFATAWPSGTWHTWNGRGIGLENAVAYSHRGAELEAEESVVKQKLYRPRKGWNAREKAQRIQGV